MPNAHMPEITLDQPKLMRVKMEQRLKTHYVFSIEKCRDCLKTKLIAVEQHF